ncbi:MAG: hypothetical protein EXS00_08770 [Phycisphaerales bacterium]|nr:hypothetical protein [Phycisphaerales bacterium]
MLFLGEYLHALDSKQRLAIPAEMRDVMNPMIHGVAFIAVPTAAASLSLWPEKTFEQLASSLGGSLMPDENLIEFERSFFSQAARLLIDSAGRVRIPDRQLSKLGLAGNVMILGVRDHVEVCTPESWKAEQTIAAPNYAEVMRKARAALNNRGATSG